MIKGRRVKYRERYWMDRRLSSGALTEPLMVLTSILLCLKVMTEHNNNIYLLKSIAIVWHLATAVEARATLAICNTFAIYA